VRSFGSGSYGHLRANEGPATSLPCASFTLKPRLRHPRVAHLRYAGVQRRRMSASRLPLHRPTCRRRHGIDVPAAGSFHASIASTGRLQKKATRQCCCCACCLRFIHRQQIRLSHASSNTSECVGITSNAPTLHDKACRCPEVVTLCLMEVARIHAGILEHSTCIIIQICEP
jgi:hypothetical protein